MERRNLLFAGGAALTAAAGIPALLNQASAQSTTTKANRTVFDFGAKGDGVSDDSGAFTAALQYAATQGQIVVVPGFKYAIAKPIKYTVANVQGSNWGFLCQGATLISKINTGEDVMSIGATNTVRYFQLTGGLTIRGTGSDGNGLRLWAHTPSYYLYNCTISNLSIENCGQNGLFFEGNVFESTITTSFFQDNRKNGATFAHSKGGICSAIVLIGCYFNQNGNYGMAATDMDNQYGGCMDVRVYGGYCRDNKSYGFYYNNGTYMGAAIDQVGFENNCRNLSPGDPNGAHVYALCRINMRNCSGYNEGGGATYLFRGWLVDFANLQNCSQDAGGSMAATGKSRLLQLDGQTGATALMVGCLGGIDVRNPSCTWTAMNCTGPSPKGALSISKTITSI
jgi:hypothetical protein